MNPLERLLAHMTLEQKIGQMICFGVGGMQLDKECDRFLEQYPFQNIGLFPRNADSPEGLKVFVDHIQEIFPKQCIGIPAMVLASYREFSDFFDFPTLLSLAACCSCEDAYDLGRCIAQWLTSCKITHLIGPYHNCEILPESQFAELMHGLEEGGLSCIPALCEEDQVIPAYWQNALLSKKTDQNLLEALRSSHENCLLCYHIGSIPASKSFGQQAVKLVRSGVDLFIQCHSRQEQTVIFKSLLDAVKENTLPMERIDHAVCNILQSKINSSQCFLHRKELHPLQLQLTMRRVFRNSVTMAQNLGELVPAYSKKYHRLLVIVPESAPCNLSEFLSSSFCETRVVYFPDSPQPKELQDLYRTVDQSDLTVCCLHPKPMDEATLSYLRGLSLRRPTIYIDPSCYKHTINFPRKSAVILTYSMSDAAMQAASEIIIGKLRAEGQLPSYFNSPEQ